MTIVAEAVCPAVIETAAIVEAEWIRLKRSSVPVRDVSCELPAGRRGRRRVRTVVTIKPMQRTWSTHRGRLRPRWPACAVWVRQRSPPIRM